MKSSLSGNNMTINKPKLYHLVITKYSKAKPVRTGSLDGVVDFLKHKGIHFIYSKYHNDGKYSQLHSHHLVRFSGKYSSLRYPTFHTYFDEVNNPAGIISYINQGHKNVKVWQDRVTDTNYFRHFYSPS